MLSDYELMTYRQLQRACKGHGLDANGTRRALLERLSTVKVSQPKRRSIKIKSQPVEEEAPAQEEEEEEEQQQEEPPGSEPDEDAALGTEGKQEVVGCIIRRVAPSGESNEEENEDFVFVTDDEVKQLYTEAFTSRLTELVAKDEDEDEDESDTEETQTLGSVLSRHTRKLGLSRSASSALLVIELSVVFFAFLLQGQVSPPPVLLLSANLTDAATPAADATVSPPAAASAPPAPVPPATPLPPDPFAQASGSLFEAGGEHQLTPPRPKLPTVEPSKGALLELLSAAYTQAFSLTFWTNLIGYFVLFIVVPTAFGLLLGKYTTPQSVFAFAVTRFALWYLLTPGLSDDLLGFALSFKLFMITTFVSLTTAFWDHCKA